MNRECIYTHGECHYPNSKCSECPMLYYWCDEVEIAVDIAHNAGMNDGYESAIEECARIISEIPNMCGHTCPIDCDQKTAGKCVDAWKVYLKAQMEV